MGTPQPLAAFLSSLTNNWQGSIGADSTDFFVTRMPVVNPITSQQTAGGLPMRRLSIVLAAITLIVAADKGASEGLQDAYLRAFAPGPALAIGR